MKSIFTKILDFLKIIALFIKSVIKKIMNFFARFIYIILTIGYIGSLATAYYLQDTINVYNNMAIGYAQTADSGYKAYETVKNINQLNGVVKEKLKERYKIAEKNISNSIKNVNEKKLAQEMLFGKKIEDTTFIKNIKSEVRNSFEVDIQSEIQDLSKGQNSHQYINTALELLQTKKIALMVLLLLSFPFLSPLILGATVLTILSKKYLRHFSNPNEANYITMVPSTYIVNLILALAAVALFYFNENLGLVVAALAHLLFIWKLFNGLLLRRMGECLSCGQGLPTEYEQIGKIKNK